MKASAASAKMAAKSGGEILMAKNSINRGGNGGGGVIISRNQRHGSEMKCRRKNGENRES
jgi:hypothetical protein